VSLADAVWFWLNPATGRPEVANYDRVREAFTEAYPIGPYVPDHIFYRLEIAINCTALAYEQMNLKRYELWAPITDKGLSEALVALELALKDRLGKPRDDGCTLGQLIQQGQGKKAGLIPRGPAEDAMWEQVLALRNDLTHRNTDGDMLGPTAVGLVEFAITTISRWYLRP
jgi:hypothetical protein